MIDVFYMKQALGLANLAFLRGEVPVGALLVFENRVIGRGYNKRETLQSPILHAEIEAINEASEELGTWRLENSTLYVTLEPCIMCSGAILQSRIPNVVFGALDPKAGGVSSLYTLLNDSRLNHRCTVTGGILEKECSEILTRFFRNIRGK